MTVIIGIDPHKGRFWNTYLTTSTWPLVTCHPTVRFRTLPSGLAQV